MPKYNDFDLDLQNENLEISTKIGIRTLGICEERTIRPCKTDYFYCEPEILDTLKVK